MPATINGVGTGYWGKKNQVAFQAVCDHCGHPAVLRSYDTWYCFVVVFLPVVPLGKRRIIDQCSRCSRHYVLTLKEWEQLKTESITTATQAYKQEPGNSEKAAELITTVISFKDEELFTQLAPVLEQQCSRQVESLLLLAEGYGLFSDLAGNERCLRAALALSDDFEIREAMAHFLVRQSRPDAAKPYLEHILATADVSKFDFLVSLVAGLQACGLHRDAAEVLERMTVVFPEQAASKQIKKMRTLAENHQQTGKKIAPARQRDWRWPLLLVIMLVAVGTYFFFSVRAAKNLKVYLVNGVYHPYRVTINGQTFDLSPQSALQVTLGEGPINVNYQNAQGQRVEREFSLTRSLITRPFNHTLYVINPDGAAILLWQQIEYRVKPAAGGEGIDQLKLEAGRFLYSFDPPDFAFRDFPEEIDLMTDAEQVEKDRVALFETISVLEPLSYRDYLTTEELIAYYRHHLDFDPTSVEAVHTYCRLAVAADAIELLRTRLADRPLLVEWHRAYQVLMEKKDISVLQAEYRTLVAAEPENKALMYLLARILRDPVETLQWFKKSAGGVNASPFAMNGLAYFFLCRGEFEEGLSWSAQAVAGDEDNSSFADNHRNLMLGAGRLTELLEENRQALEADPQDIQLILERVKLLGAVKNTEEINTLVFNSVPKIFDDPAYQREWRQFFNELGAYAGGDRERLLGLPESKGMALERALAKNDLEGAVGLLKEGLGQESGWTYLGVSALAFELGQTETAAQCLAKGTSFLTEGTHHEREFASMLTTGPKSGQEILDLELYPRDKRLALVLVGQRFPQYRDQCFQMARRLNYERIFPYLTVERILNQ